jgi:prevent-host-death family protein
MISIGIRELRQRASRYIALVRQGDTVQVTDRGRPVALLVPIPQGSEVERLDAEGRLSPAQGDLLALGLPLAPMPGATAPSVVLEEMRADER